MKKSMRILVGLFSLFVLLCEAAVADVTINGKQTRGEGSDGRLTCRGESIQRGGFIYSATDSGAGFWIQSDSGRIFRFENAAKAVGTSLPPGTWYAYPNLPANSKEAGVSVIVKTGGDGSTAATPALPTGTPLDLDVVNAPNHRTWHARVTISSVANGTVDGQIEWPALSSIHRISGTLRNGVLTFKEVSVIKKGQADLNCVYVLTYKPILKRFEGTWYEEGKMDVYHGDCSLPL